MMMLDSGTTRSRAASLQHRKLADRPQLAQRGALGLVCRLTMFGVNGVPFS